MEDTQMADYRYRYCQYIPDLFNPSDCQDFAVVVASDKEIALAGVDLSAFELDQEGVFGSLLMSNSFDVIWERILSAIRTHSRRSGKEALEHLETHAPTNMQMSEIGTTQFDGSTMELAAKLFGNIKRVLCDQREQAVAEATWHSGPRFQEQVFAAVAELFNKRNRPPLVAGFFMRRLLHWEP